MLLAELDDDYHIFGYEFRYQGQQETRALRKSREAKEKTIGAIKRKMLEEALEEVGLMPDGTLKPGITAQASLLSGRSFQTGVLMLLKQALSLVMLVYQT